MTNSTAKRYEIYVPKQFLDTRISKQ